MIFAFTSQQALSQWRFLARGRNENIASMRNGAGYHQQVQKNQMHWKLVRSRPQEEDYDNN